jgi:hypothetical protein
MQTTYVHVGGFACDYLYNSYISEDIKKYNLSPLI